MNESANKKPIGIVMIAIYTGFGGVLSFGVGVWAMFLGEFAAVAGIRGVVVAGMSILMMAYGVLALAAIYGLWTLQNWGHKLVKILYIVSIPIGLAVLVSDTSPRNVIMQIFGIAIAVWILVYLYKPETKSLFTEV